MAKNTQVHLTKLQQGYETGLKIGAAVLVWFHMLLSVFRYTIDYYHLIVPYERWAALLLILAFAGYIVLTRVKYPRSMKRISGMIRSLFHWPRIFPVLLSIWYILICIYWSSHLHAPVFQANDWWIYDTSVSAFLLFPAAAFLLSEKNGKKRIELVLHGVLLPYTLYSA